jgi:hypothetical protein
MKAPGEHLGLLYFRLIKPDMAILRTSWLSCRLPQQATQDQA